MLIYLRYSLATFCFAASVGGLALWWRSESHIDLVSVNLPSKNYVQIGTSCGDCGLGFHTDASLEGKYWEHTSQPVEFEYRVLIAHRPNFAASSRPVRGNWTYYSCHFPLWFLSLIFALAGVSALRLGRRFSLRSAIIATAVGAGLLGMAVGM